MAALAGGALLLALFTWLWSIDATLGAVAVALVIAAPVLYVAAVIGWHETRRRRNRHRS